MTIGPDIHVCHTEERALLSSREQLGGTEQVGLDFLESLGYRPRLNQRSKVE